MTFSQAVLCLSGRQPPQIVSGLDPDLAAIDHDHRRLLQVPRSTIASWPVSLPAIAKWLEASASVAARER